MSECGSPWENEYGDASPRPLPCLFRPVTDPSLRRGEHKVLVLKLQADVLPTGHESMSSSPGDMLVDERNEVHKDTLFIILQHSWASNDSPMRPTTRIHRYFCL